MRPSRRSTF
jgi:hypothetical protein